MVEKTYSCKSVDSEPHLKLIAGWLAAASCESVRSRGVIECDIYALYIPQLYTIILIIT